MISPSTRRMLPGLCVVVLGLIAYGHCFGGPLIFDDSAIREDAANLKLWPPTAVLTAPVNSPLAGRPVVAYSMAINYALGGLRPAGYHIVNLAIHLGCGLLVLGIVGRMLLSPRWEGRFTGSATVLATIVAALWVAHPLASEPVLYTLQRSESLAAFFYLLTLWCAVRSWSRARGGVWAGAAIMACGLGMGSKEIMVSAPVVVLLYDRTFVSDSFKDALKRHGALYLGLAATWLIMIGLYASGPRGRSVSISHPELTPWDYLRTQAGVILWYLRLCFWPHPLSIVYDWPVTRSWAAAAASGLAVLALVAGTGWAIYRRWAAGVVGALFFLVLGPSSSIVPMVTEIVAERRMYLPLAGVICGAVVGGYLMGVKVLPVLSRRAWGMWAGGVAGVAVVALAGATVARVSDYRTALSIWENAFRQCPRSVRVQSALRNVGLDLANDGKPDAAILLFRQILSVAPERWDVRIALGAMLASEGKAAEARGEFAMVVSLAPGDPAGHRFLAEALRTMGQKEAAAREFAAAAALEPGEPGGN